MALKKSKKWSKIKGRGKGREEGRQRRGRQAQDQGRSRTGPISQIFRLVFGRRRGAGSRGEGRGNYRKGAGDIVLGGSAGPGEVARRGTGELGADPSPRFLGLFLGGGGGGSGLSR